MTRCVSLGKLLHLSEPLSLWGGHDLSFPPTFAGCWKDPNEPVSTGPLCYYCCTNNNYDSREFFPADSSLFAFHRTPQTSPAPWVSGSTHFCFQRPHVPTCSWETVALRAFYRAVYFLPWRFLGFWTLKGHQWEAKTTRKKWVGRKWAIKGPALAALAPTWDCPFPIPPWGRALFLCTGFFLLTQGLLAMWE